MKFRSCLIPGCDKEITYGRKTCEMHYYRKRRTGSYDLIPKTNPNKITFEENDNKCFIVNSHKVQKNGYFMVGFRGKKRLLHRVIYEECFGEIPDGLVIRHTCDNKKCINPEHLIIGTHADNTKDAIERNRYKIGEDHPNSKLTNEQVKEIKRLIKKGEQNKTIAAMFNVDPDTVSNIKTGKHWKTVNLDEHGDLLHEVPVLPQ